MSHQWVNDSTGVAVFTSGERDVDGNVIQNDLGPEDLLCHKLRELLVADADLLAIFTADRIEVLPVRFFLDFREFPRLQIYPTSTTEEQRPTKLDTGEAEIFVAVRYDATNPESVDAWDPTVATLIRRIKHVLRANRQLKDQANAQSIQLARNSRAGAVNFLVDVDQQSGRIAYTHEMSWIYEIDVDDETGLIAQIKDAGGS